jgi:hypothetical protein
MINIGDIVKLSHPQSNLAEESFWGVVINLHDEGKHAGKVDVHWMDDTENSPQRTVEKINNLRTIELGENNVSR